jgi:hypothetical protein
MGLKTEIMLRPTIAGGAGLCLVKTPSRAVKWIANQTTINSASTSECGVRGRFGVLVRGRCPDVAQRRKHPTS